MKRFPPRRSHKSPSTSQNKVVGGSLLLPIALMVEGPFAHLSKTNIQGLIYLGVIGTGLAYLLSSNTSKVWELK